MNAADIKELFAPVLQVRCRRMFGGHGVYDGEQMFALEADGEVFLKADLQTLEVFRDAGSRPFTYEKADKIMALSYWLLPEEARDDEDALKLWVSRAMEAARRAAAKKAGIRPRRVSPP
jgi:DNA transformation protein and related proteins